MIEFFNTIGSWMLANPFMLFLYVIIIVLLYLCLRYNKNLYDNTRQNTEYILSKVSSIDLNPDRARNFKFVVPPVLVMFLLFVFMSVLTANEIVLTQILQGNVDLLVQFIIQPELLVLFSGLFVLAICVIYFAYQEMVVFDKLSDFKKSLNDNTDLIQILQKLYDSDKQYYSKASHKPYINRHIRKKFIIEDIAQHPENYSYYCKNINKLPLKVNKYVLLTTILGRKIELPGVEILYDYCIGRWDDLLSPKDQLFIGSEELKQESVEAFFNKNQKLAKQLFPNKDSKAIYDDLTGTKAIDKKS